MDQKLIVYCTGKPMENLNILGFVLVLFCKLKAIVSTLFQITGVITHLGRWENMRRV